MRSLQHLVTRYGMVARTVLRFDDGWEEEEHAGVLKGQERIDLAQYCASVAIIEMTLAD